MGHQTNCHHSPCRHGRTGGIAFSGAGGAASSLYLRGKESWKGALKARERVLVGGKRGANGGWCRNIGFVGKMLRLLDL